MILPKISKKLHEIEKILGRRAPFPPKYATASLCYALRKIIRFSIACFCLKPDYHSSGNVDSSGHGFGWCSNQHLRAYNLADNQVGVLLDAIDRVNATDQTMVVIRYSKPSEFDSLQHVLVIIVKKL